MGVECWLVGLFTRVGSARSVGVFQSPRPGERHVTLAVNR